MESKQGHLKVVFAWILCLWRAAFDFVEIANDDRSSNYQAGIVMKEKLGWVAWALRDLAIKTVRKAAVLATKKTTQKLIASCSEAKEEDVQRLESVVAKWAHLAGVSVPKCYVTPEKGPKVQVVALDMETSAVVMGDQYLYRLDDQELDAVVGHEMSHVVDTQSLVNQPVLVPILAAVLALTLLIPKVLLFDSIDIPTFIEIISSAIAVTTLSALPMLAISRRTEFGADDFCIRNGGDPNALISSLRKANEMQLAGQSLDIPYGFQGLSRMIEKVDRSFTQWFGHSIFLQSPPIGDRVLRIQLSVDHMSSTTTHKPIDELPHQLADGPPSTALESRMSRPDPTIHEPQQRPDGPEGSRDQTGFGGLGL